MPKQPKKKRTIIALVRTGDRKAGIERALDLIGTGALHGKQVLLKPNFNTADPFPASTHNDTLAQLILQIRQRGAKRVVVGERSGPPDTGGVLERMGVPALCNELGAGLINFEDLPRTEWVRFQPQGSHWQNGFLVAKPVVDAECVVTTCCLKTHGYGGVFTMSLKLSVGITSKRNMAELHTSIRSIRSMIAEINTAYRPALILLDGIEAFTDRGPSSGTRERADVILAGTDRIAIDAVGLAVLKDLGSTRAIMQRKIFEQEQIRRAVELGLGISSPGQIEFATDDDAGNRYAERLRTILAKG